MGYTTKFTGRIEIEPPLNAAGVRTLRTFSEDRHDDIYGSSPWCNFRATGGGTAIVWNGSEKTCDATAWVRHIIEQWVACTGRVANGELVASGEDPSDVWALRVTDNVVRRVEGRLVFEEAAS